MNNCNECKFISLTEIQQQNNEIDHKCLKHKVRVIHRNHSIGILHDFIYPCNKCKGEDFQQR